MSMAKQGAMTAVPRLRFPEFREAAIWDEKPLVEACQRITQGGTPDTSDSQYWDGEINWLTPAEMGKSDNPYLSSTARKITEAGLSNCSSELLPVESVIISTRAPIGHLAINSAPMAINQGCRGLIPKTTLDHRFLLSSLSNARSRLVDLGAGNTFKELSGGALKSFVIPIPTLAEQQKIADCLTSLDELIAAQGRKVEALKSHKRGLMQQLFPSEGETHPRLRFPEFRNAPEWRAKEVGDVFRVTRGEVLAMPLVKDVQSREAPYPVYSSQTKNRGLAGYFSEFLYEDAITWTTDGANAGEVNYREGKFYCTNVCGVLLNNEGYANPCVAALLNAITRNHVSYVGNPKLMNGVMAKITIPFPSLSEQQRIADCLSTLDAEITTESNQLAALKTHKHGLMQQLFPLPEKP
jgi:type I restriction enzyme S subunit